MASIVIPRRFNGPPNSGNGGYVCGRLAQCLPGPVSVRLRRPPPLEHPLQVEITDGEARLLDGEQLVATARTAELSLQPPATATFAQAELAARAYPGFLRHQLPTCFVCGPQRAAGDGLRIFAGPTADRAVWAAPWIPHASLANAEGRVPPEFLWAALDCAGAFAVLPPGGEPILLGELCAALDGGVEVGERCVVVAWPLGVDGRKRYAGTAVLSSGGRVLARARATWIEVPSH
jgi:hypothetical protein